MSFEQWCKVHADYLAAQRGGCTSCGGTGRLVCQWCFDGWIACNECGGEGFVNCPSCDARVLYNQQLDIDLRFLKRIQAAKEGSAA